MSIKRFEVIHWGGRERFIGETDTYADAVRLALETAAAEGIPADEYVVRGRL